MTVGRHHDQAGVTVARRLHNLVGWVASEEHACDRNAIELRLQCPIQIYFSLPDDVRLQILRGDLVAPLQYAGRM